MPDINLGYDRLPPDDSEERADRQPDQPPPPPIQETPTWGPSDDLRYSRVQSGLNEVQDDLDSGELHPLHAAPLLQELQDKKVAMDQKRQAAMSASQAQEMQRTLHATAVQQQVQAANQEHNAQSFPNNVSSFTDPQTGKTQHFYQKKPGEWEPMDFGESDRPIEEGDATPGEADRPIEPPTITGQPSEDGKHDLTIWNGEHKQVMRYDPATGQGTMVEDNRPPANAPVDEGKYLSDHDRNLNMNKALAMHASEPPSPRKAFAVTKTAEHLNSITARENRDRNLNTNQVAEHQRQEEVRAKAVEAKKKEATDHADKWHSSYTHQLDALQTEFNRIRDETKGGNKNPDYIEPDKRPPEFKDRPSMEREARDRADTAHVNAYGINGLPQGREAEYNAIHRKSSNEGGHAAEWLQAHPEAQAPAVKPLPKEKFSDAEIAAERTRRAAQMAAKPQPGTPEFFKQGGWGNPALK